MTDKTTPEQDAFTAMRSELTERLNVANDTLSTQQESIAKFDKTVADLLVLVNSKSKEIEALRYAMEVHRGSLRDEFAMHAIQGILAYSGDISHGSAHDNGTPETNAAYAYAIAAAMLAERAKP